MAPISNELKFKKINTHLKNSKRRQNTQVTNKWYNKDCSITCLERVEEFMEKGTSLHEKPECRSPEDNMKCLGQRMTARDSEHIENETDQERKRSQFKITRLLEIKTKLKETLEHLYKNPQFQ